MGDFFITTASRAADDRDRNVGIAELSGPFDQAQLAYSFVLAGMPDPLIPGLLDGELPWTMAGKLQTQGFALSYRQALFCGFSFGFYWLSDASKFEHRFFFNYQKPPQLRRY